jgi:hypothetical protein
MAPSDVPIRPSIASPTDAVEASSGWARSTGTFLVAALVLTVTFGSWLKAHEERSAPLHRPTRCRRGPMEA